MPVSKIIPEQIQYIKNILKNISGDPKNYWHNTYCDCFTCEIFIEFEKKIYAYYYGNGKFTHINCHCIICYKYNKKIIKLKNSLYYDISL